MFGKRGRKSVEDEQPEVPEPSTALSRDEDKSAIGFDASALQGKVHKLLKFSTFEPEQRYWLDTGFPELNAVFGSRDKGIPYGKILELAGEEHGGKTTLSMLVGGMAQRDGAAIGRIDLEDSRDDNWDVKMGLDPKSIYNIYPRLIVPKDGEDSGKKKGKKKASASVPRLQSAEELFKEAEVAMALLAREGYKKQFWFLDSVANIQTEMAIEAGVDRNMRVNLDRAMFLAQTLPRWAALAANYNATIFLINQLRDRQGLVFGDPTYSPGGRALRHACAIRARVRRCKNGMLRKNGQITGLVGVIANKKNKAGGGSIQNAECGFKIKWTKTPAVYEFMTREEAEELLGR